MATISVCMIVKNEEAVLARCLDSLQGLYEELIIVDTGSKDRTREIACRYTLIFAFALSVLIAVGSFPDPGSVQLSPEADFRCFIYCSIFSRALQDFRKIKPKSEIIY